jgi:hypothetical protein
MATKTLRVFAEYTSTGFVPMPTAGNIDYGYTLGSTFPATTPTSFQTDNPDLVVTVTAMTDFYVWIRVNGQAWNPSYTRNVRVYPDSPNINNVVMNMIIATGPAGVSSYTQIVQTSNRLYFNGATTDSIYNSKFAGKTYINELNFGTAPGLATVATSGAYADLTGKPTLATVATSGLFTDLSSKPSGTAPLSYNSGTNSFVITQANTSTNGYLSSTDWNTFNNKFATPAGSTLQYVDGTGALQTFPVLASADKLVINVRNSSGVSMPKGSVVYINGATGNKPTVALALATSDASSAQTLGLLQTTLANNAEGNVVIVGAVTDLNTSAFAEGQQLYLSPTTAGTYTATKQYAPNHLVYVGVVTRSHVSLGVIEVKVQNGYEMDELHNVSAQSPSNNDGLFYNTTTSLWEKKSIATVLGYTPYNGTDTSIKALFSATTPLSYSNGVYGISQATTSSNGYLSSTDWNTFNGKESVLSFTTPLVRTINAISINQASASTSGFLSSTDWNTFNNKGSGSGSVTSVAMTMPLGLSVSGSPITTSGTFGITLTAGYVIPSTTSTSEWGIAYNNRITSLTVTGSSGAATLVSNVLNIPTYTLVGLGGQVALNGTGFVKISGTTISYDNSTYLTTASASSTYQTIITNPVTGTGTTNTISYWTSASAIGSLALATYPSLTELAYVKGVTSSIQTQLDAKASTLSGTTNYIPKFTSSTAIGNSIIYADANNVGINVTPPTWYSNFKGLNLPNGSFVGYTTNGSIFLTQNSYFNASGSWTYINTGTAGQYSINGTGDHLWYTAISGTSGTSTTLNEKMRLSLAGNLGIGTIVPDNLIHILSAAGTQSAIQIGQTARGTAVIGMQAAASVPANMVIGTDVTGNIIFKQGITTTDLSTGTERMRLNSTGFLGIGQTNPSVILDLKKSAGAGWDTLVDLINLNGFFTGYDVDSQRAGIQAGVPNVGFGNTTYGQIGFATRGADGYNTRMRILPNGNVGIGTSSPNGKLEVAGRITSIGTPNNGIGAGPNFYLEGGGSSYTILQQSVSKFEILTYDGASWGYRMAIFSNGNISINDRSDSGYRLYVGGAIYASGNIVANSDLILKKNLKIISNPIDKLMQLNGYAYQWKENDQYQYGVIAQEVEKILPYAVSTSTKGIKGVSYNQIIPVLIEAIKVQNKRIVELESKLA